MKKALVCGAGGFIGGHLVKFLKEKGYWVRGIDLKYNEFHNVHEIADEFIIGDLRDPAVVSVATEYEMDEIYQLAADMGGAGFIFTGNNDADIMHNSALVNLNIAHEAVTKRVKKVFYSSSACIYPEHNQLDPDNPNCVEDSAYPAHPDSEYGWEKLFSERMYLSFMRNKGLEVRIARFHNIFGPYGSWTGGREKDPAAMCRKAAEGARYTNEVFPVRYGVRRGSLSAHAVRLCWTSEYWLRRNDLYEQFCTDGSRHFWKRSYSL